MPDQRRSDNAIELTAVTKRHGEGRVVDEVTLDVPRASVFGLIGPHGAGKTTGMLHRLDAGGA